MSIVVSARSNVKVVDRVLGVPWHNNLAPRLLFGGYSTQNGSPAIEEHGILHTPGIEKIDADTVVDVRINSACYTADIFGDTLCDCKWQFDEACRMLDTGTEAGLIIYHFGHEGKSNGFIGKLKAFSKLTQMFAVQSDLRDFMPAVVILQDLGIHRVRLITNNPDKANFLREHDIEVVGTVPIISPDPALAEYLQYKRQELGHMIPQLVDERSL